MSTSRLLWFVLLLLAAAAVLGGWQQRRLRSRLDAVEAQVRDLAARLAERDAAPRPEAAEGAGDTGLAATPAPPARWPAATPGARAGGGGGAARTRVPQGRGGVGAGGGPGMRGGLGGTAGGGLGGTAGGGRHAGGQRRGRQRIARMEAQAHAWLASTDLAPDERSRAEAILERMFDELSALQGGPPGRGGPPRERAARIRETAHEELAEAIGSEPADDLFARLAPPPRPGGAGGP